MLTLYHLRNSRSDRIIWLLEELALDYEIVRYERDPTFRAPPETRRWRSQLSLRKEDMGC